MGRPWAFSYMVFTPQADFHGLTPREVMCGLPLCVSHKLVEGSWILHTDDMLRLPGVEAIDQVLGHARK